MLLNPEDINNAFEELKNARVIAVVATKNVLANEHTLDSKKAELLMSGAIIGKNDKERDAQLKVAMLVEGNNLYDSQMNQIDALAGLEIAKDRMKEIDFLLRLDEAEYHARPN